MNGGEKGVLNDNYFVERKVCSAMVVQIRIQEKVQGLVYLENNKLAGVFHQAMAKSMSTLVSQLGISLKNAQLFEELVSGQLGVHFVSPLNFRIGATWQRSDLFLLRFLLELDASVHRI